MMFPVRVFFTNWRGPVSIRALEEVLHLSASRKAHIAAPALAADKIGPKKGRETLMVRAELGRERRQIDRRTVPAIPRIAVN